jgi:hypothetical protein
MYHGTDHEFQPGDIVKPGMNDKAYATDNATWASVFANDKARFGGPKNTPTGKSPRLFRVEPLDPSEVETGMMGTMTYAHTSKLGFRVVAEEPLRD